MRKTSLQVLGCALLATLLASCAGMSDRPKRKKLPGYIVSPTWEGKYSYGLQEDNSRTEVPEGFFSYSDTTIDGKAFFLISLHDPAVDSLALAAAKLYEPLAGSAIAYLQQQGKEGVVADFRGIRNGGDKKSHIQVRDVTGQTAPIIVLWDNLSAGRAAAYVEKLQAAPGLKITFQQQ
ncbi:hypothetical protein LX64_01401 [Chitinophaga skermanii]|uniref:Lipoprotein n=1 Tax=Chitinophaga skermanii TaxID=331697 RepID=A0A327R4D4_9BACT|nr:hypothetical protein [Chitinophaga skermanii]RAJ08747.1 hypothetical protein LX64_01401 [Chitinophaga skermanii]